MVMCKEKKFIFYKNFPQKYFIPVAMSSHYPCPSSSSEMAHADVEIGTNMAPSQEHMACGTILENYKDPNIAPEEENIKFDNVPEDLSCSISLDIFKEPVLASDGFVCKSAAL